MAPEMHSSETPSSSFDMSLVCGEKGVCAVVNDVDKNMHLALSPKQGAIVCGSRLKMTERNNTSIAAHHNSMGTASFRSCSKPAVSLSLCRKLYLG